MLIPGGAGSARAESFLPGIPATHIPPFKGHTEIFKAESPSGKQIRDFQVK